MDPKLLKNIQSHIKEAREELANLLQRLIRIRSYSGEEKEIVEFILDTMQYYGFDEQNSDGLGNACLGARVPRRAGVVPHSRHRKLQPQRCTT